MEKYDNKKSDLKRRNGSNRDKVTINEKVDHKRGTKMTMTTMGLVFMLKTQDTDDALQEGKDFEIFLSLIFSDLVF